MLRYVTLRYIMLHYIKLHYTIKQKIQCYVLSYHIKLVSITFVTFQNFGTLADASPYTVHNYCCRAIGVTVMIDVTVLIWSPWYNHHATSALSPVAATTSPSWLSTVTANWDCKTCTITQTTLLLREPCCLERAGFRTQSDTDSVSYVTCTKALTSANRPNRSTQYCIVQHVILKGYTDNTYQVIYSGGWYVSSYCKFPQVSHGHIPTDMGCWGCLQDRRCSTSGCLFSLCDMKGTFPTMLTAKSRSALQSLTCKIDAEAQLLQHSRANIRGNATMPQCSWCQVPTATQLLQ